MLFWLVFECMVYFLCVLLLLFFMLLWFHTLFNFVFFHMSSPFLFFFGVLCCVSDCVFCVCFLTPKWKYLGTLKLYQRQWMCLRLHSSIFFWLYFLSLYISYPFSEYFGNCFCLFFFKFWKFTSLFLYRSQLEQKETELRSKGIITSLAAQQQIAAGNSDAVTDVARTTHLEAELRECKVCS